MIEPILAWALFALLCVMMVVAFITLHKVRAVHLASYRLLDDVLRTRRETESLFGQIQALLALERTLQLPHPLPALRGWVGSPDFLLSVAEEVARRQPRVVVECSSGVSTIVIARMLQKCGHGHVFSLEHEDGYARKTRALLDKYGLASWATVLHAPLHSGRTSTPWYRDVLPDAAAPVDMVVVDGPPESVGRLAREPAFPRLRNRLAASFAFLIDDADRPDEIEMVRRWKALEPNLRTRSIPAEKGLVVVEFGE